VVGETAVIGDDVTLYHQVTLGAVGWKRDSARQSGERRHPVVGDRVMVGANATILGPVTIGEDAVIGAQALVVTNVPAGARALAPTALVRVPSREHPVRQLSVAQEWDLLRLNASAGSW
jgi:serine O-acetyltransferase